MVAQKLLEGCDCHFARKEHVITALRDEWAFFLCEYVELLFLLGEVSLLDKMASEHEPRDSGLE